MAFYIIAGNSMDGFTYYGPFQTREEAVQWAAEYDDEWTVTDLSPANDDDMEL